MPKRYQNNRANQRSNQRDTGNINIANSGNLNNIRHQPYTDQCSDNSTNETKWKPPTNNGFSHKTDNSSNYQINDEVEAKRPDIVTNFDRNTGVTCEH